MTVYRKVNSNVFGFIHCWKLTRWTNHNIVQYVFISPRVPSFSMQASFLSQFIRGYCLSPIHIDVMVPIFHFNNDDFRFLPCSIDIKERYIPSAIHDIRSTSKICSSIYFLFIGSSSRYCYLIYISRPRFQTMSYL